MQSPRLTPDNRGNVPGVEGGEAGLEPLGVRALDGLRESGHNAGQSPVLGLQLLIHVLQGLNLF